MKKIAVIGASGFIGFPLFKKLSEEFEVIGTHFNNPKNGFKELDIRIEKNVLNFLNSFNPEVIFHLAAITDVDFCEENPEEAFSVHVHGTKNLVEWAKKNNPFFIYFSTDFVFNGLKGNYRETDKVMPINVYGRTKLQGENIVKELENFLIVRLSTPFNPNSTSKKFINTAVNKLRNGEKVVAFHDLKRSPTLISDLTENMVKIVKKNFTGIIHLAGDSQISMFEAAKIIARVLGFNENLVEKKSVKEVSFKAVRPLNTTLNIEKAKSLGLKMKSFEEAIKLFKYNSFTE
jgi:dTDP-4-dehydrorhamnose reductase